jgi:hypothetical protein
VPFSWRTISVSRVVKELDLFESNIVAGLSAIQEKISKADVTLRYMVENCRLTLSVTISQRGGPSPVV